MAPPAGKTWFVIPIVALAIGGIAALQQLPVPELIALAALAAAITAAIRAFAGPSLAAALAAACGGAIGALAMLDSGGDLVRNALAGAAATFAIAELARPPRSRWSPLPALGSAIAASVLEPSYAAVLLIAGVRFAFGPWRRPRWAILVPLVGAGAVALCVLGMLGRADELWHLWARREAAGHDLLALALHAGDVIGPITAVAAVAGLASCGSRGVLPALALLGATAGVVALAITTGQLGALPILAALAAGIAIARLASLVRWPAGQACIGAVAGLMLLAMPAFALIPAF